ATAAAGLALAAFALILRLSGSSSQDRETRYEETAENGTITLAMCSQPETGNQRCHKFCMK
ncbi:MAG: hypothetical protein AAF383_27640, partial [Cyanobacteria bacterium P01_A01_bin.83]